MSKSVFIIGAGASSEFGLPLGSELLTGIASVLRYRIERGQLAQIDETMHQAYGQLTFQETERGSDINPYSCCFQYR